MVSFLAKPDQDKPKVENHFSFQVTFSPTLIGAFPKNLEKKKKSKKSHSGFNSSHAGPVQVEKEKKLFFVLSTISVNLSWRLLEKLQKIVKDSKKKKKKIILTSFLDKPEWNRMKKRKTTYCSGYRFRQPWFELSRKNSKKFIKKRSIWLHFYPNQTGIGRNGKKKKIIHSRYHFHQPQLKFSRKNRK